MTVACRSCGHVNRAGVSVCAVCNAGAHATPVLGLPCPIPPSARAPEIVPVVVDDDEYRLPSGQGWAYERFRQAYVASEAGRQDRYAVVSMQPGVVLAYPARAAKDPGTGFVLEMLPAFFGFYGIGYIWAGDVGLGLALLVGNWAVWFVAGFFVFFFTVFTLGLALFCLAPLFMVLYFAGPVLSGVLLHRRLRARQALVAGF